MSDKKSGHDEAGAIRAAGGAFGKLEAAHEDEYFYKQVKMLNLKVTDLIG